MQVTEESAVAHCPLWKGPKISVAGEKIEDAISS